MSEEGLDGCAIHDQMPTTDRKLPTITELIFRNPSWTAARKSVILRGAATGCEVFRNQRCLLNDWNAVVTSAPLPVQPASRLVAVVTKALGAFGPAG